MLTVWLWQAASFNEVYSVSDWVLEFLCPGLSSSDAVFQKRTRRPGLTSLAEESNLSFQYH